MTDKNTDITQLSKPLLQSEGSLNWSKHVTPGTLSVFQDEKSWNGISSIDLKRRKSVKEFKDVDGLCWNTMRESMQLESEGKNYKKERGERESGIKDIIDDSFSESGSPATTRLDEKDMGLFGVMPMEDDIVVVKCKNCERPLLASKFKEHSGKD